MSFTQQLNRGVTFHTCDAFTKAGGVAHGFATRLGGVSKGPCAELNLGHHRHDTPEAVAENYDRFCAALGTDRDSLVLTHQVHEATVRTAARGDILPDLFAPIPYEADGLITNEPGLCLTIYYADCVPVFLYDPKKKVIAAVHSGWRGTALAIAAKAAGKMREEYGSDPADILAAIGPAIGSCCFETHNDVTDAMLAAFGDGVRPFCVPLDNGKFSVDLKGIIAWQLKGAGLKQANISTLPLCTACHPELYWSHRRLGDARGNQAAMLQLL